MGRLVAAILLASLIACAPGEKEHRRDYAVMGTEAACRIITEDRDLADEAFDQVAAVFDSVNTLMSTWSETSEISRLNRAPADSAFTLSPWMVDCLHMSIRLQQRSGGAFDATAEPLMRLWGFYRREGRLPSPMEIAGARKSMGRFYLDDAWGKLTKQADATAFDLGGIAKGFAVNKCEAALRELGFTNALVDLGGNMACLGAPAGKEAWSVGIKDPLRKDQIFAKVELRDESVATSGSYERFVTIDGKQYGHIMNPATGRPAEGLLSATAIHKDAALADGLSTALFVLGPVAAKELLMDAYPNVDAVLVIPGEEGAKPTVWITPGLKGRFELLPEYVEEYLLSFKRSSE